MDDHDVQLDEVNRRDIIIQSVIDNVDYCDDSTQAGDENNDCQEGIEADVKEMLMNGNVDKNLLIIIQNGECNDNVQNICNKTNDDGKTIKQLQSENTKLIVLNIGSAKDENECTSLQDILDRSDILCREGSTNTPSIIPTSSPTDVQCKNFVIVVDQSESIDDKTCKEMNEYLLNLVSQLLNENESRVSIFEYGKNGANVVINLDKFSIDDNNRRTLFLNKLEREAGYCDNSKIDENHYCKEAIDLGEDEIFSCDNIVTDPNSTPTLPHANYLTVFENGNCNDNEDVCKNDTFKEELENVNVKSYIFNFGPNAVKNKSGCIVTDNYDKG